ncbi:MAG: hypothetical protein Q9M28_05160 [Mariprofundaceae bacterium]|nr:hypothetical protein [Mariprofundaceae bacterium]
MNEFTLVLLVVILCVVLWPFWQNQAQDQSEQKVDDERLRPLLRGINYLLNDDSEQALQALLQVARMHTETAEVYLALGDMFRQKGEVGRAVRIHQSLLARPDLESRLILETQFALAKDYQSGGFLDRAIKQYDKILHVKWNHLPALQASLRIYEQTASWNEALSCLDLLRQVEEKDVSLHRAYLLVEIALLLPLGKERHRLLESAIATNNNCQHAWLCLIEASIHDHDFPLAKKMISNMFVYTPDMIELVPVYFPDVLDELYDELMRYWLICHSQALALNWMDVVHDRQGELAMLALRDALVFKPAFLSTHLRYIALTSKDKNLREKAISWKKTVTNYCCHACGVRVLSMRWQCPQCHCWGQMYSLLDEV